MKYLVAVDLETTGLKPDYHEVTEVSIVLLDTALERVGDFHSYVRIMFPERGYENLIEVRDKEIDVFEMTGIDPKQLEKAPHPAEVGSKLMKFLRNKTGGELGKRDLCLFGQNTKFDESFLRQLFVNSPDDWPFDYHVVSLDSIYTAWHFKKHGQLPGKVSQRNISEEFGIINPGEHRATNDINVSIGLLKCILNQINV